MNAKRKLEVFSAGRPVCQSATDLIDRLACPSCEMTILDMNDIKVARHARDLGVCSAPAVAIDGQLASCCAGHGVDEAVLRAAGLGQLP